MINYQLNRIIIYSIVFVFQIFGLFGNVNLIILTYRKKNLQTKYGLILMILAIVHSFCLAFEYISMGFGIATTFFKYQIHRNICFYTMFPYIFSHSLQTVIICILSFDLFLTVYVPLKHLKFHVPTYFPIIFSPAILYGIIIVFFGWIYIDRDIIPMCNPPSALSNKINSIWYFITFIFSILTLVLYILSFGILWFKKNSSDSPKCLEKKAMLTLKFLIIIFLFVRFFSNFSMNILSFLGFDDEIVELAKNYNVVCALVAYSQNAYVCYFRSSEYRQLFNEQLSFLLPRHAYFAPPTVKFVYSVSKNQISN